MEAIPIASRYSYVPYVAKFRLPLHAFSVQNSLLLRIEVIPAAEGCCRIHPTAAIQEIVSASHNS
jgi:hypothetical protein